MTSDGIRVHPAVGRRMVILRAMFRCLSALGALAPPLLVATVASASVSAHLVYVRNAGAESCPDEEGLRRAVAQRVGYDPFFPWAKTTVVMEVSNDGQAFVAHVQLVDDRSHSLGARDLRSGAHGCGGLIDAAALAISIALELTTPSPSRVESSPAADDAPSPNSSPEPSPAPTAESPPPSASPPEPSAASVVPDARNRGQGHATPLSGAVGADLMSVFGQSPEVIAGLGVWGAVRRGAGSLGLEVRGNVPSAFAPQGGGGHAELLMVAATLAPCAHVAPFFGCALGTLGWLHASGSDVSAPGSGWALALELGPRVGVELTITRALALRLYGDLMVNAVRPAVSLDGLPWRMALLSGEAGAGLAYPFP